MYTNKEKGKIGEDIATKYLIDQNYHIITKNFKCRQGEIDIIARDKIEKEIVFVEVKTRTNKKYGSPSEAVDEHKQKHIYKSAEYYVYRHNLYNKAIRFDIIEINIDIIKKKIRINHIKKVFC